VPEQYQNWRNTLDSCVILKNMKRGITFLIAVFAVLIMSAAVGDWHAFMAYHNISNIIPTGKIVYVLSSNDLFAYNTSDQSITTFNKVTSLSDCEITNIAYNKTVKNLIVVYSNQNIDLIDDKFNVTNISDIYSKITTDDKTINNICINGVYAYLSTNFGIIKLNMKDAEVTNTYNFGAKVNSCVILDNNIYAASPAGIYLGNENNNLIDKSNWKIVSPNSFNGIYNYNNTIVCFTNNYIFKYNTDANNYNMLDQGNFTYLSIYNGKMIIGNSSSATVYSDINNKSSITTDGNTTYIAYDSNNGYYWYNQKDGALAASKSEETTLTKTLSDIIPNSPKHNYFYSMLWKNDILYCTGGGIAPADAFWRPFGIYTYDGNKWTNYSVDSINKKLNLNYYDIDHIAVDPSNQNHIFATSGGEGLFEFLNGEFVGHYDSSNSPIHSAVINSDGSENPYYYRTDAATFDSDGNLWLLCSYAKNALLEYTKDKKWNIFNNSEFINSSGISYGTMRGIIFDSRNLMWFVNAHWIGGALFCYDKINNKVKKYDTFVNQDGTNIEITYVRCVTEDMDGNIWIGTNAGPLELTSSEIENGGTTFTQVKIPRNDGTNYADYLLSGIDISCITIDGGNRKWFGTLYNGAFLINADNMETIHHFTSENSNLLSDNIESLEINGNTGEVYFGTDKGLVSYMSDANNALSSMTKNSIYAYPNPVKPDYTGLITVTGLTYNANVKIVTTSGIKVAEKISNGGIITWDGCDLNGKKVASGIYNVITATSDGSKGAVCKIAIIK